MHGRHDLSTRAVDDSRGISRPPARSWPLTLSTHAPQGCFPAYGVMSWGGQGAHKSQYSWFARSHGSKQETMSPTASTQNLLLEK